jgi:hypothetical protein
LLGASLRWAHHWGPVADTIVVAWALATLGSLVTSTRVLMYRGGSRRLAKLGLWLGLLSVLALVAAGLAAASGATPPGCGGG